MSDNAKYSANINDPATQGQFLDLSAQCMVRFNEIERMLVEIQTVLGNRGGTGTTRNASKTATSSGDLIVGEGKEPTRKTAINIMSFFKQEFADPKKRADWISMANLSADQLKEVEAKTAKHRLAMETATTAIKKESTTTSYYNSLAAEYYNRKSDAMGEAIKKAYDAYKKTRDVASVEQLENDNHTDDESDDKQAANAGKVVVNAPVVNTPVNVPAAEAAAPAAGRGRGRGRGRG